MNKTLKQQCATELSLFIVEKDRTIPKLTFFLRVRSLPKGFKHDSDLFTMHESRLKWQYSMFRSKI